MMHNMMDCGAVGWLMMAGAALKYAVLLLAGAALIKYLFFASRREGPSK
jgi:hypothetical protein